MNVKKEICIKGAAMFSRKLSVLILLLSMNSGLFAQNNLMNEYFDADKLNDTINSYISNVSDLIPDTTTFQNVWAKVPNGGLYFGGGINGSIALLNRNQTSNISKGAEAFGADNIDLTKFPEGVPFLPAVSFDIRVGYKDFDFGLTGTWLDEKILSDSDIEFFGNGSSFAFRYLGFDMRYTIPLRKFFNKPIINLLPLVTVQTGYFYTGLSFGVFANYLEKTESVKVDFRNDSYLLGLQISKGFLLDIIMPYIGVKFIFSKTDSEYNWYTNRPVMIQGQPYLSGVKYTSATNEGDLNVYNQIYGGIGFALPADGGASAYTFVIGGAYSLGTNHFSLNASIRLVLGR